MIVCITGSRKWHDSKAFHIERGVINFIGQWFFSSNRVTRIVIGDGTGVDKICENLVKPYCLHHVIQYDIFKADWDNLGRAAGPARNRLMTNELGEGDACLAFPIGDYYVQSPGTYGTMKLAKARGADVYKYDEKLRSLTNW